VRQFAECNKKVNDGVSTQDFSDNSYMAMPEGAAAIVKESPLHENPA